MENNNPKKSKAFIIAFILILLLLLAGYYLFTNRATIFDTKGVVTMQKVFAPLLGSSKNKDLGVIGGPDTTSTTGKIITGVITTDQNGNKVIQVEAGENIKKGDVLYIYSFNKNNAPIIMKAIASEKSKSLVFGVAGEDMNKGTTGHIIIEGILSGVPTNRTEVTAWTPKNPLYLSDKIYGGMTKNPPNAPSFVIPVGSVISVDAINGSIRVGGILNDTNITADSKTNLNKLNGDFLNSASGNIRDYYDSVFGINTNNKVTVTDNNNGFILNPITVPGSNGFSGNLPTVTAVASPASIVAGGSSVISWISTKATVCSAGTGNGTGTTGSFKTGVLTKSKSFTISCTGANGSKSSGNTFVAVVAPDTCINKATNYPACDNITTCLNGATNPPTCTTNPKVCTNGATNTPTCTNPKICINGGIDYPVCTPPAGQCWNGATNPPLCDSSVKICMNGATNPPACDSLSKICTNGSTNYPACDNIATLFPSVKVTAKPTSIKEGDTTVISWTSTKAVSCDMGDGNKKGTTGSFKTGVLTTNTSFSVVCVDAKGSKGSGNVYVTISPIVGPPDTNNTWPTIKVKATPVSIKTGGTSTISWTSTNTTSCNAGIGASTNPNGSFITEALSESRSYTVTCKGDKGEISSDAYVNVSDLYKFPTVTVTATPTSVDSGKTSTISWTSTNSTSCNAGTGRGTGITGSFSTGALTKTTSYTVTCIGPNGQKGGNISVSVNGGSDVLPDQGTKGKPQCSDGIDNNGNKLIDRADPNCHAGGDINATYDPTHDSESTPPAREDTVTIANSCTLIDKNPLVFTEEEKARLDVLLRKFYLISSTLHTIDDITTINSEIEQNKNFISQIDGYTKQCYLQTNDNVGFTDFCQRNKGLCSSSLKEEFATSANIGYKSRESNYTSSSVTKHGNPWFQKIAGEKPEGTFPYTDSNTGYAQNKWLEGNYIYNKDTKNYTFLGTGDGPTDTRPGNNVISGYYYGTFTSTNGYQASCIDSPYNNFPGSKANIQINNDPAKYLGFYHAGKNSGDDYANEAGYPGDAGDQPINEALDAGCSWKDGVDLGNTERILNIW